MNTLKVIVDEIRTSIKQTFDDKEVSRAQVAHWVIIVGNTLRGLHQNKRSSGQFLSVYPVPVEVADTNDGKNIMANRKFVRIPADIFDYDRDGGVEYMAFYDPSADCRPEMQYKTITRTTPGGLKWLMLSKKAKPGSQTGEFYFWRSGDIFYIVGIEGLPVKEIEVGVYHTIKPLEQIDIDAPFEFPDELLYELKRRVTDLARYTFLFPNDTNNDGSSGQQAQNVPKIMSVNDNPQA